MKKISHEELSVLKSPLDLAALSIEGDTLKSATGATFQLKSGVPVLLSDKYKDLIATFETMYVSKGEPWDYSSRAVEQVRHVYVVEKAKELIGNGQRILDLGCALGQLTHLLQGVAPEVWAMDISPTAAVKAEQILSERTNWPGFKVLAGSATELPFADSSFRVVLLSDGLVGWELNKELQMQALHQVQRVLEPGGYAILTDYLHPRDFESHKAHVLKGPLKYVQSDFLGDRVGFQIANNFKPVSHIWPFKPVLGSLPFNQFLSSVSKPFGPSMSKHLSIILQKA